MFDYLLLLQPGGHVCYFGPFTELPRYCVEHGMGHPPVEKNIADFMLEQVKARQGSAEAQHLPAAFLESELGNEAMDSVKHDYTGHGTSQGTGDNSGNAAIDTRASMLTQIQLLTVRRLRNMTRDVRDFAIRILLSVFFGFVVGTMNIQLLMGQRDAGQRISSIFLTILFAMFLTTAFLFEVYLSRAMYFRETSSNMYTAWAYHVSRFLAHTPFVVVEMLILAVMVNYISGINTSPNYFIGYYYLALCSVRLVGLAYVFMVGSIVADPNLGNTIVFFSFSVFFASSGFLIPTPSIGWWWRWFSK
jgi:ATP-binding cassette subfamily G (WHITE) protein 2 (SNQ2)